MKLSRKSKPKRILVFSMTNIGDVVLTCPVIDILKQDFPHAAIDVMVGPKAVSLFEGNPNFNVKVFDKRGSLSDKRQWFLRLYGERYDCVIDLRHTMLPLFLMPRFATPVMFKNPGHGHKKQLHLERLRQAYAYDSPVLTSYAIVNLKEDEIFYEGSLLPALEGRPFVVMAPGAADAGKRWHKEGFAQVADQLSHRYKVVFVGDAKDAAIVAEIQGRMKHAAVSLAGKINLRQFAYILKKASWALTHDSGVMHLASYLNVPLVVLWGPTDMLKYAPWSQKSVVVRRNSQCARCLDPKSHLSHTCMAAIEVQDVMAAIEQMHS